MDQALATGFTKGLGFWSRVWVKCFVGFFKRLGFVTAALGSSPSLIEMRTIFPF